MERLVVQRFQLNLLGLQGHIVVSRMTCSPTSKQFCKVSGCEYHQHHWQRHPRLGTVPLGHICAHKSLQDHLHSKERADAKICQSANRGQSSDRIPGTGSGQNDQDGWTL